MKSTNGRMKTHMYDLFHKRTSFKSFAKRTMKYWRLVADKHLENQDVYSLDADDVVQELLLACWLAVKGYDPRKGAQLAPYVIHRSLYAARRELNRQRGAKRYSDREPSRCPVPVGLDLDDVPAGDDVDQERVDRVYDALSHARSERDRIVLETLILNPSIDLVTSELFNNPETKELFRFSDIESARRSVYRIIKRLATEAETERLASGMN